MPRFSVIIPLYNKENFIKKTIESVLSQEYQDFEIIVVHDCSTDGSLDKVKEVLDKRISIVEHLNNKGLSASRNTGIANAQADFIAFLDADDTWKPYYLVTINQLIESYPEAHLYATTYEVLLRHGKIIQYPFHFNFDETGIVDNFFERNLHQSFYYPSCLCVNKAVFAKIGTYNEAITFSEDVDFNIRAHSQFRMAFSNTVCVQYLQDSENQITQGSLHGKVLPNYNYYEQSFPERKDIKRYLDFQRYTKAKKYKLSKDTVGFEKMRKEIDSKNLNWKQNLLLRLPNRVLQIITKIKYWLQQQGINLTTY